MGNSLMMMQSFLQLQSSAMNQHHQKILDSLHQDTRSLRTEMRGRSAEGNREDYPYSTGEGGQRQKEEDLECDYN